MKIGMEKKELFKAIRKLNTHYKMKIHYRTGFPNNGDYTPCCDWFAKKIIIPNEPAFHSLHVLAHEYTHLACAESGNFIAYHNHNSSFEKTYRQICKVLGIEYISTLKLQRETILALSPEHRASVLGFSDEAKKALRGVQ